MKVSVKLNILYKINKIYDDFIAGNDLACDRLCSYCCTRNVTMTTLEGYRIIKYLESSGKIDLLFKVKADAEMTRYVPLITTNQMAQLGYEGKEIPEEDTGESVANCPVLENNECPIYEARPFGCRCLVSTYNCKETGYAEIEPFIVTLSNVFYQFIEHIDFEGFFGNFTDVLLYLESQSAILKTQSYSTENTKTGLLKNNSLSALLIPPEHREQIRPILKLLQNIQVPKA